MAVIAVMSAKGAPGTTTTALLLSTLWPAPTIMLDADPLGGDVGLRLQRSDGRAMDPERGLLSLLPAARRGLDPAAVTQHTQEAMGGQPVLVGLPGPEQALAVAPLWPTLGDVFTQVPNVDMFIDVGQVQARSTHLPLIERSDLLVVVYRPTAWSALHTRRRLEALEQVLKDNGVKVGIVGVTSEDDEGDRQTAAAAIRNGLPWINDYGAIAFEPRSVVMFEGSVVYRPERTLFARSGREVAERIHTDLSSVLTVPTTVEEPVVEEVSAALPGADPEAPVDPTVNGKSHARRRGKGAKSGLLSGFGRRGQRADDPEGATR